MNNNLVPVEVGYEIRIRKTETRYITKEKFEELYNFGDTLFEIEKEIMEENPNYILESICVDNYGY